MVTLKQTKLALKLGIFELQTIWIPDEEERKAAWEMYVELVTRVSVVQLRPDEGTLREALSSLYTLFDTTRRILREHGPTVARRKEESTLSFGHLAVGILNDVIRPTLAYWHPRLLDHENGREASVSRVEHEKRWEHATKLREELEEIRGILLEYANLLAEVSDIPPLVVDEDSVEAPGDAEADAPPAPA